MYQYNAQAPVSPNNWRAYNTEAADHWTGAKYSCDIMLSNLGYLKKNRCVFYFVIWMSHTRANYDEWCSSQKNAINLHASVHGRDGTSLAPCEAQPTNISSGQKRVLRVLYASQKRQSESRVRGTGMGSFQVPSLLNSLGSMAHILYSE